jgi:hypothetical protein
MHLSTDSLLWIFNTQIWGGLGLPRDRKVYSIYACNVKLYGAEFMSGFKEIEDRTCAPSLGMA